MSVWNFTGVKDYSYVCFNLSCADDVGLPEYHCQWLVMCQGYQLPQASHPQVLQAGEICTSKVLSRRPSKSHSASQDLSRFSKPRHIHFVEQKKYCLFLLVKVNVEKFGQRNRDSTWSRVLFTCRSLLQRPLQCLCMCRWRQHKWHYPGIKPEWIMVCLEKKIQTFS